MEKKNILIVVGLFFTFTTLFLFVSFFAVSLYWSSSKTEQYRSYILSKFDPSTNKSTTTTVRLTRNLGKGEVISYFARDKFFTISPLSSKMYHCTGSCICNDEQRRAFVIPKFFFYAAVTITLFFAINLSHEYIDKQCERVFSGDWQNKKRPEPNSSMYAEDMDSDYCPPESRSSEVECELAEKVEVINENEYFCSGRCITTPPRETESDTAFFSWLAEKYDEEMEGICSSLYLEGSIILVDDTWTSAETVFRVEQLQGFCNHMSLNNKDILEKITRQKEIFHSGVALEDMDIDDINFKKQECYAGITASKNIECKKTYESEIGDH